PTVNIEGLVAGYAGQGGKTILPGRAVAKMDLRLVPDMKAKEAAEALKAHLAKRGFGDIEVNVTGGYDSPSTPPHAPIRPPRKSGLQAYRNRTNRTAPDRRLLARLRFHRRAAQNACQPLRPRPWQRRARSR